MPLPPLPLPLVALSLDARPRPGSVRLSVLHNALVDGRVLQHQNLLAPRLAHARRRLPRAGLHLLACDASARKGGGRERGQKKRGLLTLSCPQPPRCETASASRSAPPAPYPALAAQCWRPRFEKKEGRQRKTRPLRPTSAPGLLAVPAKHALHGDSQNLTTRNSQGFEVFLDDFAGLVGEHLVARIAPLRRLAQRVALASRDSDFRAEEKK